MRLVTLIFCCMFFGSGLWAQPKNIFLERDYWKSNPKIEDIELKIAEGNDVSELNRYAFDAVTYA